ncbi:MAG: KH domain-containing protein [Proteobacteria bacterium]|nr:KH domain-containing protein [Pseudomonadota bacterium]
MIEVVAKTLVDLPDQVSVAEVQGENTTVIELRVAKTDIGKIIGKQGNTAKAIRTILLGAATKIKRRTVLEIVE